MLIGTVYICKFIHKATRSYSYYYFFHFIDKKTSYTSRCTYKNMEQCIDNNLCAGEAQKVRLTGESSENTSWIR